ncbi:hypothetical protein PTTG_29924, partial [Puccinia triticina 1-1 BBBD Race 1]
LGHAILAEGNHPVLHRLSREVIEEDTELHTSSAWIASSSQPCQQHRLGPSLLARVNLLATKEKRHRTPSKTTSIPSRLLTSSAAAWLVGPLPAFATVTMGHPNPTAHSTSSAGFVLIDSCIQN